jgi:hypothetical protein
MLYIVHNMAKDQEALLHSCVALYLFGSQFTTTSTKDIQIKSLLKPSNSTWRCKKYSAVIMAESYRRGLFADSRFLRRPKTRLYRRVDIQRPKA